MGFDLIFSAEKCNSEPIASLISAHITNVLLTEGLVPGEKNVPGPSRAPSSNDPGDFNNFRRNTFRNFAHFFAFAL